MQRNRRITPHMKGVRVRVQNRVALNSTKLLFCSEQIRAYGRPAVADVSSARCLRRRKYRRTTSKISLAKAGGAGNVFRCSLHELHAWPRVKLPM